MIMTAIASLITHAFEKQHLDYVAKSVYIHLLAYVHISGPCSQINMNKYVSNPIET